MSVDLVTTGMCKSYGEVSALMPTSIKVSAGEFISILGPSGSGKTTMLMLIAGFAQPSGGNIFLGGSDITQLPPEKRNIGVVFQNYALFPHLSVFNNIAFPLKSRRLAKQTVDRQVRNAAAMMQIEQYLDRFPAQLSGGQQQRVALARAVVYEPSVLLMDEPLGALDRNLREDMKVEIKELHRRTKSTIVYVTHDQEEALSLSDRVMLMNRGAIQQISTPTDLFFRPNSEFSARFVGETNILSIVEGPRCETLEISSVVAGEANSANGRQFISIRPTRIKIAPPVFQDNGGTSVRAISGMKVSNKLFHGETTKITLSRDSKLQISIQVDSREASKLRLDDVIQVLWDKSDEHMIGK